MTTELEPEVKEFFESNGEKAPEQKEDSKPTPEAVKEPEPKPEVKEEPKGESKEVEVDPHAENHKKALKEAREEMKRLKREQKERDEKTERELSEMREKFKVWAEAVNKQNQPQPPKFEEDPANHLRFQQEQQQRELEQLRAYQAQQSQLTQQQQAIQKFQVDLNTYESQYSQVTPDYPDAAAFIGNLWKAEIELQGIPPEQQGNAYFFKVAQFANSAIRRGENPAEAVYELARRAGYKPKEPVKPEGEQKIEAIQKGMEASKSLGSGKADANFSLDALKDMSPSEIEEFVTNPKSWAKLARS